MYNDYQLADNLSAKAMRQKFDTIQSLESNDIREMHEKIRQQRDFLQSNNIGGKYDKIITKMNESLYEMSNIWQRTQSAHTPSKASNLRDFLRNQGAKNQGKSSQLSNADISTQLDDNAPQNQESEPNSEQNQINGDGTIPPSQDTNNDNTSNRLNDSNDEGGEPQNSDTEAPNTGEIPPQNSDSQNVTNANARNTYKRNFPLPGSILYRLSQSLFVNTRQQHLNDKQSGKSSNTSDMHKSGRTNKGLSHNPATHTKPARSRAYPPYFGVTPPYNNFQPDGNKYPFAPPHDSPFEDERCDPREKCITNQLDILRMMLLFMALRPNCRYLPRICRIASTQLDILSEMMK